MQQITTLSFFRFSGTLNRFWALSQMGIAPLRLGAVSGLQLIKFMGSGAANGFSIKANLGVYGILAIWESEPYAKAFFQKNSVFQRYLRHSQQHQTVYLHHTMSHGQWNGQNPFVSTTDFDPNAPVAVITRASLRKRLLWQFWKKVPTVSADLHNRPGLRFAVGIGELPLVEQATFSIWNSGKAMMDYAYKRPEHQAAITQTRALDWYKEELFARFLPYKTDGGGFFDLDL